MTRESPGAPITVGVAESPVVGAAEAEAEVEGPRVGRQVLVSGAQHQAAPFSAQRPRGGGEGGRMVVDLQHLDREGPRGCEGRGP